MTTTHIIYHIKGIKVGCTHDFEKRRRTYPLHIRSLIEIHEELQDVTDQEAGDIEWYWADYFGYKRRAHYTVTRNANKAIAAANKKKFGRWMKDNLTIEQLIDFARKGGIQRASQLSPERLSQINRHGGFSPGSPTMMISVCPHCGLESKLIILKRWHFDRCPKKIRRMRVRLRLTLKAKNRIQNDLPEG